MLILNKLKVYTLIVNFFLILPTIDSNDEKNQETPEMGVSKSGDTEAEFLDKEYGVRYASACEGKECRIFFCCD